MPHGQDKVNASRLGKGQCLDNCNGFCNLNNLNQRYDQGQNQGEGGVFVGCDQGSNQGEGGVYHLDVRDSVCNAPDTQYVRISDDG